LSFFVTGIIERSAKRRYLSYSEADFDVFQGRHVAPMGVKFGMEETEGPSSPLTFTPIGANRIGLPKLKV